MTTIRKIVTSKVDGNSANSTNSSEIRPFGEIAVYLDTDTDPDTPVLMMFDGVKTHLKSKVLSPGILFGSNADSGDGNNRDTIKLIPDATLYYNDESYGNDQYIVVDPTGGEPGHIHLRAGGTQDASSADLYLGGEETCVRVSDTSGNVTIRTTNQGDPDITMNWTFDNQGNLYFPGIGNNRIGESEPGLVVSSDNGVVLQSNNTELEGSKEWIFGTDGNLTLPNTAVIRVDGSNLEVGNVTNFNVEAAGVVNIYTDTEGETPYQWQFGDDGSLTVPGDIHGAPLLSPGPTPSQVGRTVNITPADDASDKAFKFRIDQYGETFTRSYLELPTAEVDKQVAAVFPHTNNTAGYIFTQGTNTNDDGMNDAFNIFYNNGDIKITSMGSLGGLYTWKFGEDGNLTLPNDGVVSAGGSGGLTLGGNFDVKIIADYTDNNRTWSFNGTDGSLTFPDSTVQSTAWAGGRVVTAPTASTGAEGDQQGDLAFTSSHLYYCIADYNQVGHQVTGSDYLGRASLNTNAFQLTKTADTIQITVGDIISDSDGGATSTVVTVSSDENYTYVGTGGFAYAGVFPFTFTSTDYVSGGNIWKRVAWSGDTW